MITSRPVHGKLDLQALLALEPIKLNLSSSASASSSKSSTLLSGISAALSSSSSSLYFLCSARLGFRCWQPSDLPFAQALWGDARVVRYIDARGWLSPPQVQERLNTEIDSFARHRVQYWPVFVLSTGEHVGCCGLRPRQGRKACFEMGFHIRTNQQGKGYASEAAQCIIDYAFSQLHAQELFAGHHPDNTASRHLLVNKLGFVFTHAELYSPTGLQHPSYVLLPERQPNNGRQENNRRKSNEKFVTSHVDKENTLYHRSIQQPDKGRAEGSRSSVSMSQQQQQTPQQQTMTLHHTETSIDDGMYGNKITPFFTKHSLFARDGLSSSSSSFSLAEAEGELETIIWRSSDRNEQDIVKVREKVYLPAAKEENLAFVSNEEGAADEGSWEEEEKEDREDERKRGDYVEKKEVLGGSGLHRYFQQQQRSSSQFPLSQQQPQQQSQQQPQQQPQQPQQQPQKQPQQREHQRTQSRTVSRPQIPSSPSRSGSKQRQKEEKSSRASSSSAAAKPHWIVGSAPSSSFTSSSHNRIAKRSIKRARHVISRKLTANEENQLLSNMAYASASSSSTASLLLTDTTTPLTKKIRSFSSDVATASPVPSAAGAFLPSKMTTNPTFHSPLADSSEERRRKQDEGRESPALLTPTALPPLPLPYENKNNGKMSSNMYAAYHQRTRILPATPPEPTILPSPSPPSFVSVLAPSSHVFSPAVAASLASLASIAASLSSPSPPVSTRVPPLDLSSSISFALSEGSGLPRDKSTSPTGKQLLSPVSPTPTVALRRAKQPVVVAVKELEESHRQTTEKMDSLPNTLEELTAEEFAQKDDAGQFKSVAEEEVLTCWQTPWHSPSRANPVLSVVTAALDSSYFPRSTEISSFSTITADVAFPSPAASHTTDAAVSGPVTSTTTSVKSVIETKLKKGGKVAATTTATTTATTKKSKKKKKKSQNMLTVKSTKELSRALTSTTAVRALKPSSSSSCSLALLNKPSGRQNKKLVISSGRLIALQLVQTALNKMQQEQRAALVSMWEEKEEGKWLVLRLLDMLRYRQQQQLGMQTQIKQTFALLERECVLEQQRCKQLLCRYVFHAWNCQVVLSRHRQVLLERIRNRGSWFRQRAAFHAWQTVVREQNARKGRTHDVHHHQRHVAIWTKKERRKVS